MCPHCKSNIITGPMSGSWIFISYCSNPSCPYIMEGHGKGKNIASPLYEKAKQRGVK
jgi:hypothetical protein